MSKLRFEFQPDGAAASPLYLQLSQTLAQAIRDGRYRTNEALPSERVLSDALSLSRVTARKAIDQLVDQGLVRKQASEIDGRGVVLTLTARGERLWQRVMDLVERRNAEITACLSAAERAQLDRLLDRLVAHAREVAGGSAE